MKAALAGFTTPHCSSPTSRSRPVSPSASDDGAPSFRALGMPKVRVGWRPSSSIPAGFCRLVQEDKWTFDANTRPGLLKTKMFALFHPVDPPRFRRLDAANLSRLQEGRSLPARDASWKVFWLFLRPFVPNRSSENYSFYFFAIMSLIGVKSCHLCLKVVNKQICSR